MKEEQNPSSDSASPAEAQKPSGEQDTVAYDEALSDDAAGDPPIPGSGKTGDPPIPGSGSNG